MPPPLFPTDTDVVVGCCDRCGDVVYQGHPHRRHIICAICGERCQYYGPHGTTNGMDVTCQDCIDPDKPAWSEGAGI